MIEWILDWESVRDEANFSELLKERRERLGGCTSQERWMLNLQLGEVRSGREYLAREFALPLSDELEAISEVACACLDDLLGLADFGNEKGDPVRRRMIFEIVSLFDLALALKRLEETDPFERVQKDLLAFIRFLSRKVFFGSEDIVVSTDHDPSDHYHVRHVYTNRAPAEGFGNLVRRVHPLTCRLTRDGRRVLFHHRPKSNFRTLLKMAKQVQTRKDGRDPFKVHDRRGLKLVVAGYEDAIVLQGFITEAIREDGGSIKSLESNLHGEKRLDVDNPHSDPRFRAMKLEVVWEKATFEVVIMVYPDYFSSELATDGTNHRLYRLAQFLGVYGPFLFPPFIYTSVDWGSTSLRSLLEKFQVSQLGWRNGYHA